jgi:hypothetical protein
MIDGPEIEPKSRTGLPMRRKQRCTVSIRCRASVPKAKTICFMGRGPLPKFEGNVFHGSRVCKKYYMPDIMRWSGNAQGQVDIELVVPKSRTKDYMERGLSFEKS